MAEDSRDLRPQLSPVRLPQALDLLGKVLPIERQVRASAPAKLLGLPQRGSLLLGPAHKILVVEGAWFRHILLALSQMMGSRILARKPSRTDESRPPLGRSLNAPERTHIAAMPYASLRDFIDRLEAAGRLVRVAAPVSPFLEMTEIQTRLLAEGGPGGAVRECRARGGGSYAMPVLVNLFGTVERVAWGMDREPHELREIGETLAFLKQPEPPGGWREALDMLPLLRTVMAMRPRTVGAAPCQEIVLRGGEIDLGLLPVQTCWPGEPAPLITWPLVVTKGPGTAPRGRLQSRHLPHAGDRPRHHADALAQASRRGAASPALARGAARAAAGRGGDRRRSRARSSPPSRRSPTPCRNTSSPGCCAAAGSTSSTARPCR